METTMPKARVEKVQDGDTFQTKRDRWIRLTNVDVPEKAIRGGAKAKQELGKLIKDKVVTYEPVGTSYARIVAKVKVNGKSANKSMRNKGYK